MSQLHELWSQTLRERCDATLLSSRVYLCEIFPSVSFRISSEIKDGLPLLCSSWTSVLSSANSRHHFVTFCRFITLPQTATICLWISASRSYLALRNHMTERTSHLAGLWIGVFISNTSHSKKAGSIKRTWLTVKDQSRRQFCHNK